MLRFAIRRLAVAIPIIFVVATLSFFLVQLVPGSPAAAILGAGASQEQVAQLEQQLGLDQPVMTQYLTWLGHAVQGNMGESFLTGQPVSESLAQALPPTLSLAILATLLTTVIGFALGMIAAVKGGTFDKVIQWLCSLGMAIPNFWLAALLVFVFAIQAGIFPSSDYVDFSDSPLLWFEHLVLPVIALTIAALGQITFQARAAVTDVLSREYVRTLQAAGVPRYRILFKHAVRNAAIPVVTVAGLTFVFTLGGIVIIETIFNMPGMGSLMLRSVQTNDFSVVQASVLYFSIVVIIVNLITDLATAWLNPRVRVA